MENRILKPGMMLKTSGGYFALLLSRQSVVGAFLEDWFILTYYDGHCWFSCEPIRRQEHDSSWKEVKKT